VNPVNFDAVVIGAGMYGAYAAEKIYRLGASQGRPD
jgi:flavin-dependent dehydrogenase